jgi:ribosome-associated protein
MKKRSEGTELLVDYIIEGIFEKNGLNVTKVDLRNLDTRICDFFIICHAGSKTQVDSISYSVEEVVRKGTGEKPIHVEGLENCHWVLVDYGDVIVHIFQEEFRKFYNLESLWADARIEVLEELQIKK